MNSLAHIEINVSNIEVSKVFYAKVLQPLDWEQFDLDDPSVVGFKAPDNTHLFLVQTEEEYIADGFHRKQTGLNHLAFRVDSQEKVDMYSAFLDQNNIKKIYHVDPKDYSSEYASEHYYAVFFEDPDRVKLEVVFLN